MNCLAYMIDGHLLDIDRLCFEIVESFHYGKIHFNQAMNVFFKSFLNWHSFIVHFGLQLPHSHFDFFN